MDKKDKTGKVGLPDIYSCPSDKLEKVEKEKRQDVWREAEISASVSGPNINFTFGKGIRGETPGSDSLVECVAPAVSDSIESQDSFLDVNKSDPEVSSLMNPSKQHESNFKYYVSRSIEGANNVKQTYMPLTSILGMPSNVEDPEYMRNSPSGLSTPEIPTGTGLIRPPALGQSHERFKAPDTDKLSSSDESYDLEKLQKKKSTEIPVPEVCSIGSVSENTDSTNTVLNIPKDNLFKSSSDFTSTETLTKPTFIIGGAISPHIDNEQTAKGSFIKTTQSQENEEFPTEDNSLSSMRSFGSTHMPDSSECLSPPSIISVSSVPSSKKLEWDSGADVGYMKKVLSQKSHVSSLSTLERLAIGNYASVLRSDPEGGISHINKKIVIKNVKGVRSMKSKSYDVYASRGKENQKSKKCIDPQKDRISSHIHKSSLTNSPRRKVKKVGNDCNKGLTMKYNSNDESSRKSHHLQWFSTKTSSLSDLRCSGKQEDFLHPSIADDRYLKISSYNLKNLPNVNVNKDLIESSISLPQCDSSQQAHGEKGYAQDLRPSHSLEFINYLDKEGTTSDVKSSDNMFSKESLDSVKAQEFPLTSAESNLKEYDNPIEQRLFATANAELISLSHELMIQTESLLSGGVLGGALKADDYKKLNEYVAYIGTPSVNEDEIIKKQSVANTILKMIYDFKFQDNKVFSMELSKDVDVPELSLSSTSENSYSKTSNKESEDETSDNLHKDERSGDVQKSFVPYQPTPSTRTYYMDNRKGKISKWPHASNNQFPTGKKGSLRPSARPDDESSCSVSSKSSSSELKRVCHRSNYTEEMSRPRSSDIPSHTEDLPSSRGLYQDWHGTYHVAQQPPGYSSFAESHQSESTSENELKAQGPILQPQPRDLRSADESDFPLREGPTPPWTSTGSESAYETIRERHRNIREAIASSFEFYSTSPRDPRQEAIEVTPEATNDSSQVSRINHPDLHYGPPLRSSESSSSVEVLPSKVRSTKAQKTPVKRPKPSRKLIDTDSSVDASRVSLIQIQRQKYFRRMRKYINTLERLESALNPPSERLSTRDGYLHSESPRKRDRNKASHRHSKSDKLAPRFRKEEPQWNRRDPDFLWSIGENRDMRSIRLPEPNFSSDGGSSGRPWRTSTLRRDKKDSKHVYAPFERKEPDSLRCTQGERRSNDIEVPKRVDVEPNQLIGNKTIDSDLLRRSGGDLIEANKFGTSSVDGNLEIQSMESFESDLFDVNLMKRKSKKSGPSLTTKSVDSPTKKENIKFNMIQQEEVQTIMEPSKSVDVSSPSKNAVSVGVQTRPSLVPSEIIPESTENSGSTTARSVPDRLQVLHEIESRIQMNAAKVNAAMQIYKEKFLEDTKTSKGKALEDTKTSKSRPSYVPRSTKLDVDKQFDLCMSNLVLNKDKSKERAQTRELNDPSIASSSEGTRSVQNQSEHIPSHPKNKSLKFTVSLEKHDTSKSSVNKTLVEELLEMNKENEIMSLQEALTLARPHYVEEAERRRLKIVKKRLVRHRLQTHNREILADLPDELKTPSMLKNYIHTSSGSPLFSYREIRQQNKRIYQQLPEALQPMLERRKEATHKTNRIMGKFYSQRLQKKVLLGKPSRDHRHVITPPRGFESST